MKRIDSELLKNIYGNVYGNAPDELEAKVRLAIENEKQHGKDDKVMSKKTTFVIAIAAVMLIGALTALASGGFNMFRMNEDASGIKPLESAQELVKQNLGSVGDEFVTISVEEALFDGQTCLVVYRLTPVDSEHYALFDYMMQDYDPEAYEIREVPVAVKPDDQLTYETEDGETYTVPTYEIDGQLYYADYFAIEAQRKDGKTVIDYSLNSTADSLGIDSALSNAAHGFDGYLFMNSLDAEEQADGSLLLIAEGTADAYVTDGIKVATRLVYSMDGYETRHELNLSFELQKNTEYKDVRLTFDEPDGERFTLLDGKIHFTPLYGYISITYEYEEVAGEEMGITFRIYDANGERIPDGSGYCDIIGQNGASGIYTEMMQMQSLDKIPETLILEAKVIGEEKTLGRVECKVVEE